MATKGSSSAFSSLRIVLGLSIGMASIIYNLHYWIAPKLFCDDNIFTGTVTSSSTTWERPQKSSSMHSKTSSTTKSSYYRPSSMETYLLNQSNSFGFDQVNPQQADAVQNQIGCNMWKNSTYTDIYEDLSHFREELQEYETLVQQYKGQVQDVRQHINNEDKSICDSLQLHPQGLRGIFRSPSSLSSMPNGGGYLEPLLPPLRHPNFCFDHSALMDLGYLIHDFAELCHHHISANSRTVFIDMGASLDFHHDRQSPAMYIIKTFQQFGIPFDHIYGYEVDAKNATDVYRQIPASLKHSYHWYNVGVSADNDSTNNPLTTVLSHFTSDDFVVVKLDIDTWSIEWPMVQLILQNEVEIGRRIDVLYFEHHVLLGDMRYIWKDTRHGSVLESFEIFTKLRQMGIAAHYWP
jgi:hypothetical protein